MAPAQCFLLSLWYLKNNSSRNSCSLLVKTLTKLSQHGPPLPGGVSADTIRASTRIYALAPSQASFCSPTAVAGRLTRAHRTHTNPAGVNRCAEGEVGRPTATFVRTQTHKSITDCVTNQLPVPKRMGLSLIYIDLHCATHRKADPGVSVV